MKTWPWNKLLTAFACLLILLGLAPLVYLYSFGATHNFQPLSMPLPLSRGQYSSPTFKTDLNQEYQLDLGWDGAVPGPKTVDLAWQIVYLNGAVAQQGTYRNSLLGNNTHLAFYRPKPGLPQRLMLRNLQDAQGLASAHPILQIGVPEESLDMGYAALAALIFAGFVSLPAAILLLALGIWRRTHRRSLAPAS